MPPMFPQQLFERTMDEELDVPLRIVQVYSLLRVVTGYESLTITVSTTPP